MRLSNPAFCFFLWRQFFSLHGAFYPMAKLLIKKTEYISENKAQ